MNTPSKVISLPSWAGDRLRLVRWQVRRTIAALRYGSAHLAQTPILFGNSVPKSGTHLLAQVLSAFPRIGLAVDRGMGPILTYERQTGRLRSAQEILLDLQRLRAGDLCFGHVIASPEIMAGWTQKDVAHFFILRDPRDVVISHAFYIGDKATQNIHHEYYKSLTSLEEKIRVSILGRPDWKGDFPDIGTRFRAYLGWLDCRSVLVLRFEDFIAERATALGKLLDYAEGRGFCLHLGRAQAIECLSDAIDPQRSFTFRRGQSGEWRKHFTEEHKQLFKQCAADVLIRLGYEDDENW
ncbi:MAG: hypothetical protein JW726_01415 [Anaerolineales bacterium]|nr:hypothetical protein [Anaerolineales bacterium]